MINSQKTIPSDRNPLINGDSLFSIEETIGWATDILSYLSLVNEHDREYCISDSARLRISLCATGALRYAQHRLAMIRADDTKGDEQ